MSEKNIPFWRVPNRVAYIVSHSYPHSTNGYAVRTHGIARALVEHGYSVIALTRPGRPWDLDKSSIISVPPVIDIEGVRYRYIQSPSIHDHHPESWRERAVTAIEDELKLFKPSIVMAASNWETAWPAMIAARNLNLPFFYEVRGFWEITRASKQSGWDKTPAFRESVEYETKIANSAEGVFTLNEQMRDELIARGVAPDRINLVSNAWEAPVEKPLEAEIKLARLTKGTRYVVGYIGSFVSYEGLDDLVAACASLRNSGLDLSLSLVGSSSPTSTDTTINKICPITKEIIQIAKDADFLPYLHIHGRIPPKELYRYYDQIDLIVIPRKSLPVTNLVSPIKPLEAAAYGKAILVSDVDGLKDVVEEIGLPVFRGGDRNDLARQIRNLLSDIDRRNKLSSTSREWLTANRTFSQVITPMRNLFKRHQDKHRQVLLRKTTKPQISIGDTDEIDSRIISLYEQGGSQALICYLKQQSSSKKIRKQEAISCLKMAQHLLTKGEESAALSLTDVIVQIDTSLTILRLALRIYLDAAELIKAETLAQQFRKKSSELSASEEKLLKEIAGRTKLAAWAAEPPAHRTLPITPRRVLNILAFSLPYTSVGYSTRSHGLAIGIKNAGWDIRPYTRPGFPFDFKSELEGLELPDEDEIDGIVYRRIFDIGRKGISEVDYMLTSVDLYEKIIRSEKPEIVHAASNYVTALPAMIAARRLGVPFVYEVRGFWEITRSSRDENFQNTAKYRLMQLYEGITARHADRVITITAAMKEELMARGVPAEHIVIAYNSVDPERFLPRPPNKKLAKSLGIPDGVPVIGYVGSFVDYEGLDDLITACAGLHADGQEFHLLLVGDGAGFEDLKRQVEELGIASKTTMPGRVPHEMVEDYYSLIDIAPFPRKPWEVCELVSPLKPYEAMALEKAVVVSGTRALSEIIKDNVTGYIFNKGDVVDLKYTLSNLLEKQELRIKLGKSARDWILKERSWRVTGSLCVGCYDRMSPIK